MKRILCLLLTLVMILTLCACSGSDAPEASEGGNDMSEGLYAGFGRENVTPDYPTGLGGYSDQETRTSTGFVDYIYTTCVAVTSGEETILMFTVDTCAIGRDRAEEIRQAVTLATGIPRDKIFAAGTHCHSAPSWAGYDNAERYKTDILVACVKAAQTALADRSPAQLKAATPEIEGMNFVRHYLMADGTYAGSNFGSFSSGIVDHAAEADHQMVLVQFDRAEDKKDILMVNWQAHPDSGSEIGYNTIAASWIGPLRTKLESLSGMQVAYFTGPSGNLVKDSKMESKKNGLDWRGYGEKMAELTNGKLADLKPVEGTAIKTTGTMFTVEIDHSWDHLLKEANDVYNLWKSAGKPAGDALGKQYGFTSSYQARAIKSRATMGATAELEVNAFSIGGIGFTTGTYEMFTSNAMYVKEHSPFDITFLMTGNSSYIPSEDAFNYRCYEADTGYYAKGTGEKLADNYVKMLEEVK